MKKNLLKRIGAVALAVAVSMTMGVSAYAADPATLNGGIANSDSTSLIIPKGVTFINADAVTSYGPGITYTYTVGPATVEDGTTITDKEGHTGTLNAGPSGGMTLDSSSVTFASTDTFTTSSEGIEATKNIVLNVDLSEFTKPGTYRYVLTDTTETSALYAAGITRDDNYATARYIDVFIKDNNGLTVYGYAVKTINDGTNNKDEENTTGKDPGFIKDSAAEGASKTDKYETYNVTLNKEISGALADKNHEFPFAIKVSNDSKSYFAAKGDIAAAKAATATSTTDLSTSLKGGETYTIAGLSPLAKVAYEETNDTTDLYEVTAAGSSSALTVTEESKKYSVEAGDVSSYRTANNATSVKALGETTNYSAVTYTNTLTEVSPTNVVMRFAPYLFILGAAIVLLVMMRRRKAHDAE